MIGGMSISVMTTMFKRQQAELQRLRRLLASSQYWDDVEIGDPRATSVDEDVWVAERLSLWAAGLDYEDEPEDESDTVSISISGFSVDEAAKSGFTVIFDDGRDTLNPRDDREIVGWQECDMGCCTFPIYAGDE